MRQIRAVKLFVVALSLLMCVSSTYAIKPVKKPKLPKRPITSTRFPQARSMLKGQRSSRPAKRLSPAVVERQVFHADPDFPGKGYKATEILADAEYFVAKNGRWMNRAGAKPHEVTLGILTTNAMLYGKLTPAIEKLIKLRESVMPTKLQKESAMIARQTIEFVKANGRLMKRNAENPEEAALALKAEQLHVYERWGDPIFDEFERVCRDFFEQADKQSTLDHLKEFIVREHHFPYSHNWDGKEATLFTMSIKNQEEALLFDTIKKIVREEPQSEIATQIMELWEQHGR